LLKREVSEAWEDSMASSSRTVVFTRSSYCTNGSCVEVGQSTQDAQVHIRDSKDPNATTLSFNPDEWMAFVAGVKAGEFDI
jgi:hypothetical protein